VFPLLFCEKECVCIKDYLFWCFVFTGNTDFLRLKETYLEG